MSKKNIFMLMLLFIATGCTGPKCPEGYTLENDTCYKILERNAIRSTEYFCYGGNLINDKCYQTNSTQIMYAHKINNFYYCDYGYDLRGNMCYPRYVMASTRTVTSCPYGYTKNKSGVGGLEVPQIEVPGVPVKCYKKITTIPS